jgi:putative ABC transport system permease protein
MNFWNIITIGMKEIWAHKARSLLTMMGIILGVSSLVGMSALVKGMENGLREALVAMGGLEKIRVESEDDLPDHQRHLEGQAKGVTLRDVFYLKHNASKVHNIVPTVDMSGYRSNLSVTYKDQSTRPYIFSGTWPGSLALNEHVIEYGRMFNEIDDEQARSVCVIGTGIRDELFGDPDILGREINPVGETIFINQQPFTIIGLFQHYESEEARKERLARLEEARNGTGQDGTNSVKRRTGYRSSTKGGHFAFRLKNKTIMVPLRTMLIKFRSSTSSDSVMDARLSSLQMQISDVSELESSLQQVRNVLMVAHNGIEDFNFRTQEDWAEEITTTIRNARMSGSIIAIISLIVGGIGIMNIMLASISERVREIGIRKSIGATDADVFVQILLESLVLALLGGLAGLLTSYGLVQSIASFTPEGNSPQITPMAMMIAFGFSAFVGIAAGILPAFKASNLNPIQALRYD